MADYGALRYWAHRIFAAKANGGLNLDVGKEGEPHDRQAAIAALRMWLLEPEQSGVLEILRTGLAQLCWDTPSSAGRRLIADLIWRSVLARFGFVPALFSDGHNAGRIVVEVDDSPYANETWDFSGWRIYLMIYDPEQKYQTSSHREPEIEFVLNSLLYHDVELGLADRPLYERTRQTAGRSQLNKEAAYAGSSESPSCPSCGSPMRLKNRSRSHEPFWGCTNYPTCKGKMVLLPPVPRDE